MKKSLFICLAALIVLAVSCKKDNSNDVPKQKYGVDGVTPLPEAVDLGLPSGLKWASFNIGASKPEEYGDYYAWGETITYYSSLKPLVWAKRNETDENVLKYFDWASHIYTSRDNMVTKYCQNGLVDYWDMDAKPNGPDGEVKLLPSDDVAHVKLGGKWRMPTVDDINELLDLEAEAAKDNSDYIWEKWDLATDANGNEVYDAWGNIIRGIRITRKSTGATLFLPAAAGFYSNVTPENSGGSEGSYWSSSLNIKGTTPFFACFLDFGDFGAQCYGIVRTYGFPIRPVCKE